MLFQLSTLYFIYPQTFGPTVLANLADTMPKILIKVLRCSFIEDEIEHFAMFFSLGRGATGYI